MSKRKHNSEQEKRDQIEQTESSDENITIDLSKIKKTASNTFKSVKNSKIITGKYSFWILIVLIMVAAFSLRLYAVEAPITEDWARQTAYNNIKSNLEQSIKQSNQALPQATINQMVEQQFKEVYKSNKASIESQIQTLSNQLKNEMIDDKGNYYLSDIDSYLWYSFAKWREKTGFYGTHKSESGEEMFGLRNGRVGQTTGFVSPAFTIFAVHSVVKVFSPGIDMMKTTTFITPLIMALTIIPAFFLGRKLGGNITGFFTAALIAITPSILGRTLSADSDSYTFFFPILIVWLFLESIESKNKTSQIIYSACTALSIVLFKLYWAGWWFTAGLVIGIAAIYLIYRLIILAAKKQKNEKITAKKIWDRTHPELIFIGIGIAGIIIFSMITAMLLGQSVSGELKGLAQLPAYPINFILGFKGAAEGISIGINEYNYPLWPNVFTTVAELNPGNHASLVDAAGGKYFFYASILGAVLLLFRKKDGHLYPLPGILILVWMASTYYAGIISIRFTALFASASVLGIVGLVGFLTGTRLEKLSEKMNINKNLSKSIVVLILFFVIIVQIIPQSYAISKSSVPSYDDTWERAMIAIKENSSITEKAIISSWWDFGHWFQARSERSVTFDGGDQGKRIHWIGHTLLNDNEEEAVDLLKMMNCGQELGYNKLLEYLKDPYKTTNVLNEIILLDEEDAEKELMKKGLTKEQTAEVLKLTHCDDLWDMYFITSEDMVGKSSVWGHFGSWDFKRAYMYYKLKPLPIQTAIEQAKSNLGYTEEQARAEYLEVQKIYSENEANNWISPWPSYITGSPVPCKPEGDIVSCDLNIGIGNQNGVMTVIWKSIVNISEKKESAFIIRALDERNGAVLGQQSIKPSGVITESKTKLERHEFENPGIPFDFILFKDNTGMYKGLLAHPLLSESLFTKLFFLDGKYTENFEKIFDERDFRGQRIIVWKVTP